MRLRLRSGHTAVSGIYFSASPETVSVQQGDLVDVAFIPQINEFRGERTVQLNVQDIRPCCNVPCIPDVSGYRALKEGRITPELARELTPERSVLAMVWRYLATSGGQIQEAPMCLCRKIVRWSATPLTLGQLMTCLDIFQDVGLLRLHRMHKYIAITLTPGTDKADLNGSSTLQLLLQAKEH